MENLAVERIGLSRTALQSQVAVVTGAGRGIGREILYLGKSWPITEANRHYGFRGFQNTFGGLLMVPENIILV